jgi:hypothetical protein
MIARNIVVIIGIGVARSKGPRDRTRIPKSWRDGGLGPGFTLPSEKSQGNRNVVR